MIYADLGAPAAYILRARVVPLRNMLGAALSPFNSFLILQGLETLALHGPPCGKYAKVAEYLENTRK